MDRDVPHAANLRYGRFSEPGAAYHITKCRAPGLSLSLARAAPAEIIINSIRWHQVHQHAHLLAFVVMPDHVHWTFVLGETRTLDEVMHGLCSFTWQQIVRRCGLADGPLWEEEYHEHRLRTEERAWATLAYVHESPVRKGLCRTAEEWPWSTAHARYRGWVEEQYIAR